LELAEKIVFNHAIKNPVKTQKEKKEIEQKIIKINEFYDKRENKQIVDFLTKWNWWRDYYFQLPAVTVKAKSQITMIEHILEFVETNKMNQNILIGCVHRAFKYRKLKPNFNIILFQGLEIYEAYYDDIVADMEREEYESYAEVNR
jgi:hypothetical protein